MCGISAFFSKQQQSASTIKVMSDLIHHRGPDDEGYILFQNLNAKPTICGGKDTPDRAYHDGFNYSPNSDIKESNNVATMLALGHRRLSIVDLSSLGHQPMSIRDSDFWIVFNGEVYNHIELRMELSRLGYQFISNTDTEVILAAYAEWGQECLSHFNGMFSFIIYDTKQSILFAARDRFGIKPLYYYIHETGLFFASEIKQFTSLPQWDAKVNGQRAYDFLNWGLTDHTDETMFSGVFQVRGGHAVVINLQDICDNHVQYTAEGKLPTYAWYTLKPRPFNGSFDDASEMFQKMLFNAVELRLRADVSVGSCLSGGLDSSSIVCIVNELLRKEKANHLQKTFSACANESRFDERKWIDIVTNHTGVDAHYVYPALDGLFDDAAKITWHQDEPFGSTSLYAQWNVFKMASQQGVKVMLDGQGADEYLAGYHSFFGARLAELFKSFQWSDLLREIGAMRDIHGYSYKTSAKYFANYAFPENMKNVLRLMSGVGGTCPSWLNFQKLGCNSVHPFELMGASATDTIQDLSITQLTMSNLQKLLHWEDRDSMGHSIESRIPFLDYQLVEFTLGLPSDYKLSLGLTKRVLRKGMKDLLPKSICNRTDKLGFVTSEETWLKTTSPDLFREKLNVAIEYSGGVLNKRESHEMLEDMIKGRLRFNSMPWRLISFGEWMKQFHVKV